MASDASGRGRSFRFGSALVCFAAVGALACGDEDPRKTKFSDVGELCLLPTETSSLTTVRVAFDNCLGCNETFVASCTADAVGDQIAVRSFLEVTRRAGDEQPCTDVCGVASAACEMDVPAGTYDVIFGGSASVMLPLASAVAPFDDALYCTTSSP